LYNQPSPIPHQANPPSSNKIILDRCSLAKQTSALWREMPRHPQWPRRPVALCGSSRVSILMRRMRLTCIITRRRLRVL
jgi:hypothetical protein